MILIGFLGIWAGYGLASWGYCLVKGWDVALRSWFSPLSPYQWPKSGDPPMIPADQVFPSGAAQQAAPAHAPAAPKPKPAKHR